MTDTVAPPSSTSFVVTGGASGVGRAVAEELSRVGEVVVVDLVDHLDPGMDHIQLVAGDATDAAVCTAAAELAEERAPLTGWVNNAAVFRDADLASAPAHQVLQLITTNLALALTGCHTAVRHYLAHRRPGAIVNISSHQAQRPVRGALPYATAKAAVEGLTRAVAVDHGPDGIRTNALALGSIGTARHERYRALHPEVDAQMAALHPLGRVGTPDEVALAVAFLLSGAAGFINGAVIPVDGGRSVHGPDPEST